MIINCYLIVILFIFILMKFKIFEKIFTIDIYFNLTMFSDICINVFNSGLKIIRPISLILGLLGEK